MTMSTDDAALQHRNPFRHVPPPPRFEDCLAPFVDAARARLRDRAGASLRWLQAPARIQLERYLMARLASCASHTLELELTAFTMRRRAPIDRALSRIGGRADSCDREFVQQLRDSAFAELFAEYPVLGRLLPLLSDRWIAAAVELLARLQEDRESIRTVCDSATDVGAVSGVAMGLSDPHAAGRTVIGLEFETGCRVVYKPRPLGLEAAWFNLLAHINAGRDLPPFFVARVADHGSHGWMQYVEERPCVDLAQAHRYCTRAGMTAALAYAVNGGDFHHRNVIAHGEHPVLVDLECLLSPGENARAGWSAAECLAENSVLRTGLLPEWSLHGRSRRAVNIGGFQAPQIAGEQGAEAVARHATGLSVERFVEGFRTAYRWLVTNRSALLSRGGPLAGLDAQPVRYLHRSTESYWTVLAALRDPALMRNEATRLGHCTALVNGLDAPGPAPALVSEIETASLLNEDIPLFHAHANGIDLSSGAERMEGFFQQSAWQCAQDRLARLCDEDERRQVALIDGVLSTLAAHAEGVDDQGEQCPIQVASLARAGVEEMAALDERARAIAEDMLDRSVDCGDSRRAWIGPQYVPELDRYRFRPIGENLYDGRVGLAVFLAACGTMRHDERFVQIADQIASDIRRSVFGPTPRVHGIGGLGWGGMAYAFAKLAQFTGRREYLDDALTAAARITPAAIDVDDSFDVLSGAAGAILSVLALHGAARRDSLVATAVRCGDHLVARIVVHPRGGASWPDRFGRFLTGFGHGAAGVALALDRLYAATDDRKFLHASERAHAYEAAMYSREHRNWPDFRRDPQPAFTRSWCAGAPGIGLARRGLSQPSEASRADVAAAVANTLDGGVGTLDQLCCGNAGRVEFLLEAAAYLERDELKTSAAALALTMATRGRSHGYALQHGVPPARNPSPALFTGAAGIGYTFLRVLHPGSLPSLLLWQ